jgi:hypothetical protein
MRREEGAWTQKHTAGGCLMSIVVLYGGVGWGGVGWMSSGAATVALLNVYANRRGCGALLQAKYPKPVQCSHRSLFRCPP